MLMALDDSGVDDNREDNDSLSTTTSLTTVLPMYRDNERAAVFGVAFGTFSTIVAVWFILTHYNLVECCSCRGFIKEGGGVELFAILVIILLWIVGTAVLTQYGGLAATIIGSGADQYKMHQEQIVRVEQESKTREYPPTLAPVTTSANPPESLSLEQILLHQLLATGNISNATFNVSSGNDTNVAMPWEANITNTSNSSNNTTAEPLPYPASIQLDCVFTVHNVSFSCQDLWNSNSTEFALVRINSTNANGSATTETSTTENATRTIQTIPGSNLYVAVWICLLASLNLAFRWKAQQALQFAQAAQQKAFTSIAEKDKEGRNDREGGGDDDDNEIDQSDDDYDDD
jgi:hypothetical protein